MICCCICSWRFCASLTLSPFSWSSLTRGPYQCPFGYTVRRYSEEPAGARPSLRLESWGRADQPQLIPKPLICGVLHVADSDLPPWPGALHLGEVHAKFLGLTLGGLRGVGLFLPAALGGVLGLLSGLPRRALGGVLGTLRGLARLVGDLSCCVLGL